ncbi:uncharacterized protein LOC129578805 [Sitodiplosis mosellana]|uniref:uncharacterized protein LOC129578805 n=1 Tax=Sitodiplosis mosellana TaxID=263140 RepID=UPI002444322C|nr:uncharacterized protein LOC129578805 [Sitodiplosis mosellana]
MASNKEMVVNSVNFEKQNGTNEINQKNRNKRLFTWKTVALICVINASLGLFGNGSFVGWTSYAMDGNLDETFTPQQKWHIFSVIGLTAALGPLIIHQIWHFVGSKRFILMANFLMVVAWILVMVFRENYLIFLVGRGIGGLAVGTLHFLIPLYIFDIVPVHQQPLCHSIMQLQFVLGILSQYILSLFKSFLIIDLLPAITSALLFITFFFMPESPRYLSIRGDAERANEILVKFKTDDRAVQNDLQLWTSAHHKVGYLSAFKEEFNIAYAIPVFGLYIFEQLIGAVPILFYLQNIFKLAACESVLSRVECEFTPEVSTILCVTVFVVSILVPHFFDDRSINIKVSLMWSTNVMAAILGVLGLYCHLHGSFAPNNFEDIRYIPLICLSLFYFLYATGPQRLSHEYAEKVIPKKCYFTMRCMLATTSWFLIYVITRMLPQLIGHIGVGWLFWFMAAMCVLMSVFVKLFVADLTKVPEESRLVDNSSESNSEA